MGYVEASHGCVHRCRHCPVPAVYDGRIRVVDREAVLADVAALVAAGARHITFGDPDFLNGVRHSLAVVGEMHRRFPDLTFDLTAKVEHVIEHARVWPELAGAGCLFVVCALESVDDEVLARLDKGHTTDQARDAIALLREHGIEPRPSWMPFTPWTTPDDVVDLLDFVAEQDLVGNVDPVQYTIRLLHPGGLAAARPPRPRAPPRPLRRRRAQLPLELGRPARRRAAAGARGRRRRGHGERRAGPGDLRAHPRRRGRGRRRRGARPRPRAHPRRVGRGPAAPDRTLVLLSGAHRGPVRPSRRSREQGDSVNEDQPVAVISGGNRGIGLEAARQLAAQGYRVIVGSRDEDAGREAIADLDGQVEARQLDVSDPESVERFARSVEQDPGRVDALINNAGVIGDTSKRGVDADLDEVKKTLETNTFGAWRLTQALAALLEAGGHGRVANVSSGMGQLSDMNGGAPSYRVSKTALNAVTRIFASELAEAGVKVNSVCPGWVRTDMGGSGASRSVEDGADTPVWLATLPDDGPTGGFFRNREPIPW